MVVAGLAEKTSAFRARRDRLDDVQAERALVLPTPFVELPKLTVEL